MSLFFKLFNFWVWQILGGGGAPALCSYGHGNCSVTPCG